MRTGDRGAGDYAGLKGSGRIVGVNQDDPVVEVTDDYLGSLRL